jgi:hypothetical protein
MSDFKRDEAETFETLDGLRAAGSFKPSRYVLCKAASLNNT